MLVTDNLTTTPNKLPITYTDKLLSGEIAVIVTKEMQRYNGLIVYKCYKDLYTIGHINNCDFDKNICWGESLSSWPCIKLNCILYIHNLEEVRKSVSYIINNE